MPGEMLAACRHTVVLQAADDGHAKTSDKVRGVRERAIANDWILRIGVDVEDRGVVERDSDCPQFRSERGGEARGQVDASTSSQHRHRRPLGKRLSQPGNAATFLVYAQPQWQLRCERLDVDRELGHLLRGLDIAREEGHAAERELACERTDFGRENGAGETSDQQLPDVVADGRRHEDIIENRRSLFRELRGFYNASP